jgi:hypothetical protein
MTIRSVISPYYHSRSNTFHRPQKELHVVKPFREGCNLLIVEDKGFDDDKLRDTLRALGHQPCFPTKKNRKHQVRIPKKLYCTRYRVENFVCRLKRWGCTCHPARQARSKLPFPYPL